MPLRLEIVSRHRQSLGERAVKEFGQEGGTLGRSVECDWVLPDGQRYLSNRHASIDYRSGSYYIIDTSTNGVYVNGADTPVGRGKPQRLFSGDRLRIGEYEMTVLIEDEADHTREQLLNKSHVDPVELAQRVPPPEPTGEKLIDEHEMTGVGIELLLDEDDQASLGRRSPELKTITQHDIPKLELAEDPAPAKSRAAEAPPAAPAFRARAAQDEPAAAAPATEKPLDGGREPAAAASRAAERAPSASRPTERAAAPTRPAERAAGTNPAAASARAPSPAADVPARAKAPARSEPAPPAAGRAGGGQPAKALESFFRGAGLEGRSLDDKRAELVLHRLGQLMREMIVGLAENLHVRADQKNALRVPNTTIQPQGNNPLKFAASVDEALDHLLFRDAGEYMPAVEAVREAFVDLKLHQQALLAAVRSGVESYVARLDPDELESKYASGKRGPLINAANKLKYWDVYKDLYQVVTQHSPNQFPPQLLEELGHAYEQELMRIEGGQRARSARAG